jgi:hypothetical protein
MWRARLIAALVSPLREQRVADLEARVLLVDPDPDQPRRQTWRTRYRWPHRTTKPKP